MGSRGGEIFPGVQRRTGVVFVCRGLGWVGAGGGWFWATRLLESAVHDSDLVARELGLAAEVLERHRPVLDGGAAGFEFERDVVDGAVGRGGHRCTAAAQATPASVRCALWLGLPAALARPRSIPSAPARPPPTPPHPRRHPSDKSATSFCKNKSARARPNKNRHCLSSKINHDGKS